MNRYSPKEVFAKGKTVITAHSACEGTAPNSREHILAAIASCSEMIEVDVRLAGDVLYLSHDVPEDIGSCVTLREMFELVAPEENLEMNLDVKTEGLIDPVMARAKEFDLCSRITFTGACNDDRALANSYGAEMWRSMWPNAGEEVPEALEIIKKDGSPYLNVHFSMMTDEYDAALRAAGKGFSAWTVDTEENLRLFLEKGISNITTRKPVMALKLRKEIQGM